jgi:hypothetical protein
VQRAFVAAEGLGANKPEDAIYPTSFKDADGKEYDGKHKYVMRIPKGQMPPVKAFWSLTMYDQDMYFVKNKLDRQTVSSRSKFKENPDGSVDLYFQKDSPGPEKEANWLPAPDGKFVLMLRMYWPNEQSPSILNGTWKPPGVKRAD